MLPSAMNRPRSPARYRRSPLAGSAEEAGVSFLFVVQVSLGETNAADVELASAPSWGTD